MRAQKGFVFKASGAWYVKYRQDEMENGKIVRKLKTYRLADVNDHCRTISDARKEARKHLQPFNDDKMDARSTMLLTDFVEAHWLPFLGLTKKEDKWVYNSETASVKPATADGYRRTWETYLKPKFGKITLRDIRKRDTVPFLVDLLRTGKRVAKYAKCVGYMIFKLANTMDITESNPFEGDLLPKTKRSQQHDTTLGEFSAMLKALQGNVQARTALSLMFFGGLRPSEVRGLQWTDYDPLTRQLLVQRSRWRGNVNETKTDDATALVPVNEPLALCLAELHEHDKFPQQGYVLRGERNGDSLNLDNLARRVITPTLKAVGIDWHGYYAMRRGAGTIATMVARDKGLAAKGLLRHKTLTTTSQFYIDSVPSETRTAVDEVGRMFQNCSKEEVAIQSK